MANYDDIMKALRAADAAGNTEDAKRLAEMAAEAKPSLLGRAARFADDAVRSIASGAVGTFADEFAAGMSSLTGIGGQTKGGYGAQLEAERARDKEIPAAIAIPGQIAGGVATTFLAPVKAAAGAVMGAKAVPAWMRAAGLGGAYGGVYGAGSAEGDLTDRALGAAEGAGFGALAGGATYPVVKGAQAMAGKLKQGIQSRFAPEGAAKTQMRQALERDEMTPAKVEARLRQLGPQATLADAGGENLRGLARAAAGTPGPAKNRASIVLNQRAEREAERIGSALGKLKPTDYSAAEEQFVENLRSRASPFYREAYKTHQQIASPMVDKILDTPAGKDALGRAVKKMQNDMTLVGQTDPELTAALREAVELGQAEAVTGSGVARGLKLRTLDYVKRGLDDMIGAAKQAGEKDDFRILTGLKNSLLKELDTATGGEKSLYAKARKLYSDDAQVLGALENGRDFLKLDREVIRREMGKLSDSAKEAYRSGAVRSLMDKVEMTADTASAARRIFGNSAMRGKIRELFPDEKSYNEFARAMIAEGQFNKTKNFVLGGSPTSPRSEELESLKTGAGNLGAIIGSAIPGGHALVRSGIGRRITESLVGPTPEEYSRYLSQALLSRNQASNLGMLDNLNTLPMMQQFGPQTMNAAILAAGQQGPAMLRGR